MTSTPPTSPKPLPSLLASALPWSPIGVDNEEYGRLQLRLEESERSRDWWKRRVSVLDTRCREMSSTLRDVYAENKRCARSPSPGPQFPPFFRLANFAFCYSLYSDFVGRLREENERLATELHVSRMRTLAKQTLQKIDSNTPPQTPSTSPLQTHRTLPSTPPQTPLTAPHCNRSPLRLLTPTR
jgi:hypothetical protein